MNERSVLEMSFEHYVQEPSAVREGERNVCVINFESLDARPRLALLFGIRLPLLILVDRVLNVLMVNMTYEIETVLL